MNTVPRDAGPRVWQLVLIGLLVCGAYLRVVAVATTVVEWPFRGDAGDYVAYAYNLTKFGVYSRYPSFLEYESEVPEPDAVRSPGYPLLLAPLMGAGPTPAFIRRVGFVQAAIGVVTILLTFLLARRWCRPWLALLPATYIAISPHQIAFTSLLLTETFATLLVLGAALLLHHAGRRRHNGVLAWAAVGAVLGIAALSRPSLQYFPLVFAALIPWLIPTPGRARALAGLFVGFVLVFGPWVLRNQIALGKMTDPQLTISAIHHGAYPDLMLDARNETYGIPYRFDPRSPEITRDISSAIAFVVERFRADPVKMMRWYLIGKPVLLMGWEVGQSADPILQYPVKYSPFNARFEYKLAVAVARTVHWPVVCLGLAGLVLALVRARSKPIGAASGRAWQAVLVCYLIAVHLVGPPFGRYSLTFMPIIAIAAAYFIAQSVRWADRLRDSSR